MSDEAAKPKEEEILPAQAQRQAAVETITTIAQVFNDQAGQARDVAMTAAEKTLNTLAPDQAVPTTDPDALRRVTGLIVNDMQKPGPNLVKRVINWAKKNL